MDTLFAEMLLGVGLAMAAGNGFASASHGGTVYQFRGMAPRAEIIDKWSVSDGIARSIASELST